MRFAWPMRPAVLYAEEDPSDILFMRYAWLKASMVHPLKVVRDGVDAMHYLSGMFLYADRRIYPMPCLLLLDVRMPRMSGWDVLRWIRANPIVQRLPVVMMSSTELAADVDAANRLRPDAYVIKPARLDDWVEVVQMLRDRWLILQEPSC